jgi:hypothetical protein
MLPFCSTLRPGHFDILKRNLPNPEIEWCYTVYGNANELIPKNALDSLGNCVTTVTYTDANLYHDILVGRLVTGILHLCKHNLIDWCSKRQATLETGLLGLEIASARIAVDKIILLTTTT